MFWPRVPLKKTYLTVYDILLLSFAITRVALSIRHIPFAKKQCPVTNYFHLQFATVEKYMSKA